MTPRSSRSRRIIVTGASGFIGRHALPELVERGYEVHAIGRTSVRGIQGVAWHDCDLLAPGAAAPIMAELRAACLLHLAWNAVPGSFWSAPGNLDWVAVSLQLFRAFAANGGRRAVFAGTCAEYDWSHELLTEFETPMMPRTLYGRAKGAIRELLFAASDILDVSIAWAHLFSLYGPHEPKGRLVSDLVHGLLEQRPVDCTDGTQERDYLHVQDAARALVDILDGDLVGPVNVASGACRPVGLLIDELARQIGRPDLIRRGALTLSPDEPRRLAADTRRLFGHVGFRPRIDLATGLADTIAALRPRSTGGIARPANQLG